MVPALGFSLTASSKCSPLRLRNQFAVFGATSLSVMKRVRTGAGRLAARPGRLVVILVGPAWLTVVPIRICITCDSDGAGVAIGFGGLLLPIVRVRPGILLKSMSRSARSAGAST